MIKVIGKSDRGCSGDCSLKKEKYFGELPHAEFELNLNLQCHYGPPLRIVLSGRWVTNSSIQFLIMQL